MEINEHRARHLDGEAIKVLGTMAQFKGKFAGDPPLKGSLAQQEPIIDLGIVSNLKGWRGYEVYESYGEFLVGFNQENGKTYHKLVSTIHADGNVNRHVSRNFVDDITWRWMFDHKTTGKPVESFTKHLIGQIESRIETFKIFFPIINLHVEGTLTIADTEIGYFTKEYFDKYSDAFAKAQPDADNPYPVFKKQYSGLVYCATTVTAERGRATEVALEICSNLVDILKICSSTLDHPYKRLAFDINRRVTFRDGNETLYQHADELKGLTTNISNHHIRPYYLNANEVSRMRMMHLNVFVKFITLLSSEPSEIERLVMQSIRKFASALANANHHQRVAELFTILESLVLANENSIIESLCKYISKLITVGRENRLNVIKILKEMYAVRSGWVHHAKEKDFTEHQLKELQLIVHNMILAFIAKSNKHKMKQVLLDEIDDAIIEAYQNTDL